MVKLKILVDNSIVVDASINKDDALKMIKSYEKLTASDDYLSCHEFYTITFNIYNMLIEFYFDKR